MRSCPNAHCDTSRRVTHAREFSALVVLPVCDRSLSSDDSFPYFIYLYRQLLVWIQIDGPEHLHYLQHVNCLVYLQSLNLQSGRGNFVLPIK